MEKAEYKSAVRSRQLIKNALAELLQEKPLDKITVTEISRNAHINRGTFYAHYIDVPDVCDHMIEETFAKIKEALAGSPRHPAQVPGVILSMIRDLLEEDLDFYQKIMTSSAAPLLYNRLVDVVVEHFLQQQHLLNPDNHRSFEISLRFCAGGLSMLYQDWFYGRIPLTLEQLTKEAERMLTGVLVHMTDAE